MVCRWFNFIDLMVVELLLVIPVGFGVVVVVYDAGYVCFRLLVCLGLLLLIVFCRFVWAVWLVFKIGCLTDYLLDLCIMIRCFEILLWFFRMFWVCYIVFGC